MLNLSKGQVLKRKGDNREFIIRAIIDGATFMGEAGFNPHWYTDKELEQYFELPKVKWVPRVGATYWYVEGLLGVGWHVWRNDSHDTALIELGNIFATEEAAEAAAEKIKELLKSL